MLNMLLNILFFILLLFGIVVFGIIIIIFVAMIADNHRDEDYYE